jgi:hypothetical protein
MRSSLLASVDVFEFQATDAYSSLDLTNVIYDLCVHSREEKVKAMLRTRLNSLIRRTTRKIMVDVVMKMKFGINKLFQVFNRVVLVMEYRKK